MRVTAPLFLLLFFCACSNSKEGDSGQTISFEILNDNGKIDTVNRVDGAGRRQGKWIPSVSNNLRDTVYFKDDEPVKE